MSPSTVSLNEIFDGVFVPIQLKNLKILKADYDKDQKSAEIILFSDKIIDYKIIENYKNDVLSHFPFDKLNIKIKYDMELADAEQNVLFDNLTFYVNTLCPGAQQLLNGSTWHFDGANNLEIDCKSGVTMLYKLKCDVLIKRLIATQFSKNVDVTFNDLSNEEEYQKAREEIINSFEPIVVPVHEHFSYDYIPEEEADKSQILYGKFIFEKPIPIKDVKDTLEYAVIEGEVFDVDSRVLKSGKILFSFCITDLTSSYNVKMFMGEKRFNDLKENVKNGAYVKLKGRIEFDDYMKEYVIFAKDINRAEKEVRMDNSEEKRVELHMHTKMSAMDGMTDVKTLVKTAAKWGHKAVAVTDHGNVQAFPDAAKAAKDTGIKVIYGVECYLVSDELQIVYNVCDKKLSDSFVVFDLETTGLSPVNDTIIEIGAVKVVNGEIVDRFSEFVNPQRKIPQNIVELTSITDEMVENADTIDVVLPKFMDFIEGSALVAHNATFDVGFVTAAAQKLEIPFKACFIDTVAMSRALLTDIKNHKLNTVAAHLGISLENHHRAVDDATATGHIFVKFMSMLKEKGIENVNQINHDLSKNSVIKHKKTYHAIILVKNQVGLKNLYHIISKSHLEHFQGKPRVPKSLLAEYREGLILGSACEAGELYSAIVDGKTLAEVNEIVKYYDYLEIQPLGNNRFLVEKGRVPNEAALKTINKTIIDLGRKHNKITVATCDVHFLNPTDEVFRRILMAGQGFEDADNQAPLYLRTTEEMLEEFAYLGETLAHEVVIENPNKIADMCDEILPVPNETAPPIIDGADDELREKTLGKAHELYGDPIPKVVQDRIDAELSSIIDNGYAVLYIIAERLVQKSLSDGYLVGSRGSVGSSFVAFLSGITEVNSLPPHYRCPKCKHLEFIKEGKISCGFDLPPKKCPECGEDYIRDGHDIPFETFLGFGGGKEPDIDLNFSGDYQPVAHKFTEEIFGEGHVFRAGTIGTIAEKTAYGFVKKYFEARNIHVCGAEINRLVKGCTGVKRTTGQHPGGVMIVPRNRDVHEFTPIQYPADDKTGGVITTHFDYHSISGKLLKLDILGHDDPTVIRMLEDLTKTNAREIPFADPETMSLFHTTEALGVTSEQINSTVGTFAVPEFGTKFVRQMLVDTNPTTFAELVRISGLSHGTDVWLNNAQDLIVNGIAALNETICTRDDIMLGLIDFGVEPSLSFRIMESVRKGKGITDEWEAEMRKNNVPDWYIDSCKKIKYMFPKAHAVAYVTMAYRIAWYKVHYPKEFYCTYFTVRADDFDAAMMAQGRETVLENMKIITEKGNEATAKEKGVLTILEVCNEMYCRGLKFLPIHISTSEAFKFIPKEDGIVPPLNAISGLGTNAALSIVEERKKEPFSCVDDLIERAKVNKTVVETMKKHGCLSGMRQSSQLSFFNMI